MSIVPQHDILFVPGDYPTIQQAVDAVNGPSTIIVSPGVYGESVRVTKKPYLVIQSAQLARRGVTVAGADTQALLVEDSALYLSGIEVRSNARMRGLSVSGSTINLQDCVVAGNRILSPDDPFGAGMLCRDATVRIQRSSVVGNVVDHRRGSGPMAGGGGLFLQRCKIEIAGSTIQANEVYAPGEARGGGIWCEASSIRLWRSRVTDNEVYAPSGNGGGLYFKDPLSAQLGGSVITGNGCSEGRGGGIAIEGDRTRVVVHRNTSVRQNHPSDLEV